MSNEGRAPVKTYVSQEEKAEWKAQAEQLDMSLAEYVRNMVNVGKRNFDIQPIETLPAGVNPQGEDLETTVVQTLADRDHVSWAELVDIFSDVDEQRLNELLQALQNDNRIEHDGPNGGYTLIDDE